MSMQCIIQKAKKVDSELKSFQVEQLFGLPNYLGADELAIAVTKRALKTRNRWSGFNK